MPITTQHDSAGQARVIWVLYYPPGESFMGGEEVSNGEYAQRILLSLMHDPESFVALPDTWKLERLAHAWVPRKVVVRRRIQNFRDEL